jgi:hypothetical protein
VVVVVVAVVVVVGVGGLGGTEEEGEEEEDVDLGAELVDPPLLLLLVGDPAATLFETAGGGVAPDVGTGLP